VQVADGQAQADPYGDEAAGARLTIAREAGALVGRMRSRGWGCGLSITPNMGPRHRDGSVSVQGAQRIVFRLRAPEGTLIGPTLNESGHGVTQSQTFDGLEGADGEAYIHAPTTARSGWQDYSFALADFEPSPHYGNQRGNSTIDAQAVAQVGLTILRHPNDDAVLEIESVRFE
jgi:hypothetical protein